MKERLPIVFSNLPPWHDPKVRVGAMRAVINQAGRDFRPGHGQARSREELALAHLMQLGVVVRDSRWDERLHKIFEC